MQHLSEAQRNLQYVWLSSRVNSPLVCKGLVHGGIRECFKQFLFKLLDTGKVASRYYIFFHAIPLMINLKKSKSSRDSVRYILKAAKDYLKSICFMAFLVGLLRGSMCINNHCYQSPSLQAMLVPGCLFSSVSILFEAQSRQLEIGYFICAKALRSSYIGLKRLCGWGWKDEQTLVHIVMMSGLYYIYNHCPGNLKFKSLFDFFLSDS